MPSNLKLSEPIIERPSILYGIEGNSERLELISNPELRSQFELCSSPITSFSQLCSAFRLVHRQYVRQGLIEMHTSSMHYSIYQLLRNSMTFVALKESEVSATVSGVLDSPCGLPSNRVFGSEVELRRSLGRTIAEATLFASNERDYETSVDSRREVVKWLFGWCCVHGVDDLLFVVDPGEVDQWQDLVGFEVLGAKREDKTLNGRDSVLLNLDVNGILFGQDNQLRERRKELFSVEVDPVAFIDEFPLGDLEMTFLLCQRYEVVDNLSMHQAAHLERFFPSVLERVEQEREMIFCLV